MRTFGMLVAVAIMLVCPVLIAAYALGFTSDIRWVSAGILSLVSGAFCFAQARA